MTRGTHKPAGKLMAGLKRTAPAMAAVSAFAAALCLLPATGQAAGSSDSPWQMCSNAAAKVEQSRDLPPALLQAMTIVETGRRGPDGEVSAWPWTINSEGRGYHFATKDEAIWAVRRLLADGVRSIDVGCLQVNLRYHPRAFTSLEEAFDPEANAVYAASFLDRLRQRHGKWDEATARYHSYNKQLREKYARRVEKVLTRERVALAERLGTTVDALLQGTDIQTASVTPGKSASTAPGLGLRPSLVPNIRRTLSEEPAPAGPAGDVAEADTDGHATRLAAVAE